MHFHIGGVAIQNEAGQNVLIRNIQQPPVPTTTPTWHRLKSRSYIAQPLGKRRRWHLAGRFSKKLVHRLLSPAPARPERQCNPGQKDSFSYAPFTSPILFFSILDFLSISIHLLKNFFFFFSCTLQKNSWILCLPIKYILLFLLFFFFTFFFFFFFLYISFCFFLYYFLYFIFFF